MNLMDCFNAFQKVSMALRLSPNARSLYIAILGEFNTARYPEFLNISNALLRQLSGINLNGKSDSSFQSARNALQNAGLIRHKNQVYQLTPDIAVEKLSKYFGKLMETPCKQLGNNSDEGWRQLGNGLETSKLISSTYTNPKQKVEKEVEGESRERETTAPSTADKLSGQLDLSKNSDEVLECWYACKGEKLLGEKGFALIYDENNYGAESVIKAIKTASVANNYEEYPKVTYSFFKKVLENQIKEGERNDGRRNGIGAGENKSGNRTGRTVSDRTSDGGNGTGNDNYDDFDYSWLED